MKIEGTVALVTGAAQGIGRGITEKLLELGVKWVSIIDVNKSLGKQAEAELTEIYGKERVGFIYCDIAYSDTLTDAFEQTYKKHNQLDIVINNAGIEDETQLDATVQINYLAVVRGIRLAKRFMSTENGGKGGVVINTASVQGFWKSWVPVYASTKAAIISLTRSLPDGDSAFSKGGMRAGAICPGYVVTALGKSGNVGIAKKPVPVPMDSVVAGYITIIEDDSMNGMIMTTTLAGNHPWKFKSNEEIDKELKIF